MHQSVRPRAVRNSYPVILTAMLLPSSRTTFPRPINFKGTTLSERARPLDRYFNLRDSRRFPRACGDQTTRNRRVLETVDLNQTLAIPTGSQCIIWGV